MGRKKINLRKHTTVEIVNINVKLVWEVGETK